MSNNPNELLGESLFGKVRRKVLSILVLNPERSFYLLELIRLLNSGRGAVQREVARLASYVDFDVVVCDDRREFSNMDRFPMARSTHVIKDFRNLFQTIGQEEDYYLLIITRGHSYDQEALGQALLTPARYIGMIGSRSKRNITYSNLRDQGFTDADFARVHCPVGFSIGSETPREIAVSILAELIAARSGAL